ncbi:MAG: type II toxin-antitoxin system PemK/MazF family toxin [bacterium]
MRGEIWIADLPKIGNTSIQHGVRPVVIWSNKKCNKYSSIISVFPITSQNKKKLPTHITIGKNDGLLRKSIVLAEQPRSISKDMLISKAGECSKKTMAKINTAILIQSGLDVTVKSYINKKIRIKAV